MGWNGYFTLDGVEVINASRTEAYAKSAGLNWFKPVYNVEDLSYLLGDGTGYTSPLSDAAPWVDPDVPESYGFYGFYPLDVQGIEDSTRSSSVTEFTTAGGSPGRLRDATRSVVFSGLILANNDLAADYGMRWLRRALTGGGCSSSGLACNGYELAYLSANPDTIPKIGICDTPDPNNDMHIDGGLPGDLTVDREFDGGLPSDVTDGLHIDGGTPFDGGATITVCSPPSPECLVAYKRFLKRFLVNQGPTVMAKKETTDGGAIWAVQFTGVAGMAWEFSAEKPIFEGFLDPSVPDPYFPGITGGSFDSVGESFTEPLCQVPNWAPLYDPDCPAMLPPPTPPDIPLGCYTAPESWWRRTILIPRAYIPLWSDTVPVFNVRTGADAIRGLRVRFYAETSPDIDEDCNFLGDLVISYVPAGTTLTFDAANQTVRVYDPVANQLRDAESLVFTSDGKPFDWPLLSCGYGYIVTLDMPTVDDPPIIDLSVVPRAA